MNQQKKNETQGALMMALTAIIWGVAFVFQRTGMEHIGPFAFNFFRCVLSLMFLISVKTYFSFKNKKVFVLERMSRNQCTQWKAHRIYQGF